jgi:hypothetical protein
MPKKKTNPKETPEAQHKRFKEAAREAGADMTGKKFERAFKTVVPAKGSKDRKADG